MMAEKMAIRVLPRLVALLVAASVAMVGSVAARGQEMAGRDATGVTPVGEVMPVYDTDGRLLLPKDYQQWIFAGSSLGMSYSEGGGGMEMFHHTLIEPSAYRHFARTGAFREGTMLVLLLHGQGEGVIPQRKGSFANEIHGVEMAVKDSSQFAEGWAYFGFGGMDGLRDSAEAFSPDSCFRCHDQHAAYDNVFLQFYPLLAGAAPAESEVRLAMLRGNRDDTEAPAQAEESTKAETGRLALSGLDPVELTAGREEMGKPEIISTHKDFRYQFASEPNRKKFAEHPERFSIQNDSCPVVPGAPARPSLFAVHESKIYTFATENCIRRFEEDPDAFVK